MAGYLRHLINIDSFIDKAGKQRPFELSIGNRLIREEPMRLLKSTLTALGCLCLLMANAAQSEPLKIRVAFVVPIANWAPMLPIKKDLAKHWGKSYVMEAAHYQGTPPMITALANDQVVMRKSFIDKHRAAVVDFMEGMLRIERWYLDPKNHDAVAKIAGGILKMPPERFGWVFTKQDYYRDPNGLPDLEALQRSVDTAADLGFLKSSIDVKKYADLSIVKEAAACLK
jgi:hypothetical protein